MNLTQLINSAWMLRCRTEGRRFRRATLQVETAQSKLLQETLSANRGSQYGRRWQFERVHSYREFCRRVPLVTYDDLTAEVNRIAAGEMNVLTTDAVTLLEPTSGTTTAEKLIPYTPGLKRQFQRGLAAWIDDLFSRRPAVRRGRAYWSISPALSPQRRSEAGIPIGFEDDTAYLGFALRQLARRILAVPPSIARNERLETFQFQTLLYLIAAEDLSLVSVWNPTFLTTLLTKLDVWRDELMIALGQLPHLPTTRIHTVRAALDSENSLPEVCQRLWPRLALVSSWADASAALFVPQLKELLPQAELQPKGLLATEAFVSLPLTDRSGSALALRSHFFEFEEVGSGDIDPHQPLLRAHELVLGERYRVVVTTLGGLYRYRLGDEIEVTDYVNACPAIRFMGRGQKTSDLVGEKLHDSHVREVIRCLLVKHSIAATFAMMVPDDTKPISYCLLLECTNPPIVDCVLSEMADDLERELQDNPYYRQAVEMGQLNRATVRLIQSPKPASAIYQRECARRGQRLGNIKPLSIDSRQGWPLVFASAATTPSS